MYICVQYICIYIYIIGFVHNIYMYYIIYIYMCVCVCVCVCVYVYYIYMIQPEKLFNKAKYSFFKQNVFYVFLVLNFGL